MTANFSGNVNIKTSFIKPKYGDASGVRELQFWVDKILFNN